MKKILFLIIFLFVFALDRLTKLSAISSIHEKNYGLLFGVLSLPELRWIFVALMVFVLIFFVYIFNFKEFKTNNYVKLGVLLMISGLVGNLIDRIFYGFVIDFLRFSFTSAFNFSDVSILLGALILIFNLNKR